MYVYVLEAFEEIQEPFERCHFIVAAGVTTCYVKRLFALRTIVKIFLYACVEKTFAYGETTRSFIR